MTHSRSIGWDDGYVVAVADTLAFALGDGWNRLYARDPRLHVSAIRAELALLRDHGVASSFGDGELAAVPDEAAESVQRLRARLDRIAELAPDVFAAPADLANRILCADPWPRIYTTGALDLAPSTPVHVIQASDLSAYPEEWARVPSLAKFAAARALFLFGAPLGRGELPLDLAAFRELAVLDLSHANLRALPKSITRARSLQSIDLSHNPIEAAALAPLAELPSLRHVALTGTPITPREARALKLPIVL